MAPRPIKDLHGILDHFKFLDNPKHGNARDPPIPTSCHPIQEKGVLHKMVKESKRTPIMLMLGRQRHHNRAIVRNPGLKEESLAFRIKSKPAIIDQGSVKLPKNTIITKPLIAPS